MDELPATWTALCARAFVLGARHGFDADHRALPWTRGRNGAKCSSAVLRCRAC